MKITQDIGDRQGESTTIGNMARIFQAKGDYDKAYQFFIKDLEICQAIGDVHGMAITLGNIGGMLFELEQLEDAVPYLFQSYQIFERIGSPNKDTSLGYLGAIVEQIGEARMREIIEQMNQGEVVRVSFPKF